MKKKEKMINYIQMKIKNKFLLLLLNKKTKKIISDLVDVGGLFALFFFY